MGNLLVIYINICGVWNPPRNRTLYDILLWEQDFRSSDDSSWGLLGHDAV